jgi:hypothetical protein
MVTLTIGRLLGALGTCAVLGAVVWGPAMLRQMAAFEVGRVEVVGARLLAPHEVLATAGIARGQNVWADPGPWIGALRAHPVIADAEIGRELPRTLRVRVIEKQPVAFLLDDGLLRLATAEGELLPVGLAGSGVDLPLLHAPGTGAAGTAGQPRLPDLLAEVGRIGTVDPELLGRASEIREHRPGVLRITLARPDVDVLLPLGVAPERLRQLQALLAELEHRRAREPERTPRVQIDLRFDDQIVLRPA